MKTILLSTLSLIALFALINKEVNDKLRDLASDVSLPNRIGNKDFPFSKPAKLMEVIRVAAIIFAPSILFIWAEVNSDFKANIPDYVHYTHIVLIVGPLLYLLYRILAWNNEIIRLRKDKLIYSRGLIFKKETEIDLHRISEVKVKYFFIHLYMKGDETIKLPTGFKSQALLLKIFEEYRPIYGRLKSTL